MRPRPHARIPTILAAVLLYIGPPSVLAQGNPYSDSLLVRIRAAANSVTGARARELRYIPFAEARPPLNSLVADADSQTVTTVFAVFQIHFNDRWIMVDAGVDTAGVKQYSGSGAGIVYSQARYDSVQDALRGADRIVLTHEHFDHAVGIQRGPYFKQVASKTLLNGEQLRSLLNPPARAFFPMSADSASGFSTVQFDLLYPLASGVVLIRAPGHSPGSQFVYVQLADGREILLIGDLVWNMAGLVMNHQKPLSASESLKEDRPAIQLQMDWVRGVMNAGSIAVIPCHDKRRFDSLVAQGILHAGLDLRHN